MAPTSDLATRLRGGPKAAELLIKKLDALHRLSDTERAALLAAAPTRERHEAGAELYVEQAPVSKPYVILSGWACRQRVLADGRRQILSFLLPGDAVGLCARRSPLALTATVAMTRMDVADATFVKAAASRTQNTRLAEALTMAAAEEEGQLLDHVVRLGCQTALERTAHLLLELHARLKVVGLATERSFPMPVTQEVLADSLGLSVVHMNRTLQQLRRDRLILSKDGYVTLLEPLRLAEFADFRRTRVSGK